MHKGRILIVLISPVFSVCSNPPFLARSRNVLHILTRAIHFKYWIGYFARNMLNEPEAYWFHLQGWNWKFYYGYYVGHAHLNQMWGTSRFRQQKNCLCLIYLMLRALGRLCILKLSESEFESSVKYRNKDISWLKITS